MVAVEYFSQRIFQVRTLTCSRELELSSFRTMRDRGLGGSGTVKQNISRGPMQSTKKKATAGSQLTRCLLAQLGNQALGSLFHKYLL